MRNGPLARAVGAVVPGLVLALAACIGVDGQTPATTTPPDYVAATDVDTARLAGPVQPVFYRHDVHAGQYKIDCRYCHYAVEVGPHPGMPTLNTCMGCHLITGSDNPEVQKVRDAQFAEPPRPIEWVRVHHLPPFVHFPHMRHVKAAGVTCQTCHGAVQEMPRVYRYSSLKMGWCLDCHKKNKITTDCTACHY